VQVFFLSAYQRILDVSNTEARPMQLKDFQTIEEARIHPEPSGRMISHDMIVVFLTKNRCITSLQNATDESAKGFWLAVSSGVQEFNVMNEHPVGVGNQQLLAHMVSISAVNQSFADDCLAHANTTTYPHANATEYDFKRAKGLPIAQKEVTPVNGYIKITLTQDVEPHRPQVFADIQGVKQRVTGFGLVDKAGVYLAQVPRGYASFYVDDAYGVIA
jgi:hypothetical protein